MTARRYPHAPRYAAGVVSRCAAARSEIRRWEMTLAATHEELDYALRAGRIEPADLVRAAIASDGNDFPAFELLRKSIWRDLTLAEAAARFRVVRESVEREAVAP